MKKTVTIRPHDIPWFNGEIKAAIRQRRKAERKWRSTGQESHLAEFKGRKNYVIFLMNESRCRFYTSLVEEHSNNQRELFRISKQLLKQNVGMKLPSCQNCYDLANEFDKFFAKKISDIRSELNNQEYTGERHGYPELSDELFEHKLSAFDELTEDDIRTLSE